MAKKKAKKASKSKKAKNKPAKKANKPGEELVDDILQDVDHTPKKPKDPYNQFVHDPKNLYKIIGGILLVFILLFAGFRLFAGPAVVVNTIDDLHELNFQGDLDEDEGYIYEGFSFVKYQGAWFTRFLRKEDQQTYAVQLRYGPKEVDHIPVLGDYSFIPAKFNSTYITFDPLADNLTHIALGAADLSGNLAGIIQVHPIAACTKNETRGCFNRPIVECNPDANQAVMFFKEDPIASVEQKGSCLIFSGKGFDLIKAVDKWLLHMYGVFQ